MVWRNFRLSLILHYQFYHALNTIGEGCYSEERPNLLLLYVYHLLQKDDKDPNYDVGAFARYTFFGVAWYPIIYHHW